jgi:hypothetical protein
MNNGKMNFRSNGVEPDAIPTLQLEKEETRNNRVLRKVYRYYLKAEGVHPFLYKEVRSTVDLASKEMQVEPRSVALACGCTIEKPSEARAIDRKFYCHSHICPECGKGIDAGAGVQIDGKNYHENGCADLPRERFNLKIQYEIELLAAKFPRRSKMNPSAAKTEPSV